MANPVIIPPPTTQIALETMSQELNDVMIRYHGECKDLRCPALIVSFLVITSLIVIASSCLCLSLPGVNVIHDVVLPGVLPGVLGILLSIPSMVKSAKLSKIKENTYNTELYPRVMSILSSNLFDAAEKKVRFVEMYVVRGGENQMYLDYWTAVITQALKEFNEMREAIEKRVEGQVDPIKERNESERTPIIERNRSDHAALKLQYDQDLSGMRDMAAIGARMEQNDKAADEINSRDKAEIDAIEERNKKAIDEIEEPAKTEKERIKKRTEALQKTLENLMPSEARDRKRNE